jgi:membrane protein YdfJ
MLKGFGGNTMAKILYKVGRWCAQNRGKVLFGWMAVLIATLTIAIVMKPNFINALTIPGIPAEKASDVIKKEFSSGGDAGSIRVVFYAKNGDLTTPTNQKVISDTLSNVQKDNNIASVMNPYQMKTISRTKDIAFADVNYKVDKTKVSEKSLDHLKESIKISKKAGIQTELTGNVEKLSPIERGGSSEAIGIVVAFFIIVFTFGSLVVAGLPILTAISGLGISIGLILIGTNFVDMQSISMTLAIMIGLAVGIDYALFIIARHRQQLRDRMEVTQSIAKAVGTSGSAVVFAGLTVIIALSGLCLVGIPFLTAMSITSAISVLFAVLVSITLMPAIFALVGNSINPLRKKSKDFRKSDSAESNFWGRIVTRYPVLIAIVCLLVAITVSIPAFNLKLGIADNGMKDTSDTQRRAYDLLTKGFGEGFNSQLVVVLDATKVSGDKQAALQKVASGLGKNDEVAFATPIMPNKSGDYALMQLTPKHGPNDDKTKKLVDNIHHKAKSIMKTDKVNVMITGVTAMNIDISEKLSEALPIFVSFIVIFALILLTIVFRSIFVPLKAVLGFLLTIASTLGFGVIVFQEGHLKDFFGITKEGPILAFLPIFLIGILFGLAMDYEVFLVSHIREEYMHTKDAEKSILGGMKHSGKVITAACLIMISVFASFAFTKDVMVKSMGLSLAFGVAFDAFIVRMTLVPAVMKLFGDKVWYLPKWLDKIIPNVDIEGSTLNDLEDEKDEKLSRSI